MGTLISLVILFLAAVFGLSFLFFKLICLIAKHTGNKIPLVLAGVVTLVTALIGGWIGYKGYRQFVKPFMPIVEAARSSKEPVYGEKLYTDPTYGFSFTQYNGTVFGTWLDFTQAQVLVGVDLNSLHYSQQTNEIPFAGFLLLRMPQEKQEDALQQMQQLITETQRDNSSQVKIQYTSQPQPVAVGGQGTGAFITGTFYPRQHPSGVAGALLIATRPGETYYFVGMGLTELSEIENTLQSFRFNP